MSTAQHRRRVGAVRPSHLMFTSGVGALVDLPNFSVLVRGLDDWSYANAVDTPIVEPRLLVAVQEKGHKSVERLMPAPWLDGIDADPKGPASTVGVPVVPFPSWLRCTSCDELAHYTSSTFHFVNDVPRRPHDARFQHPDCRRKPLAVAARFVLSCTNGHLDDFPYREFVHRGAACAKAPKPRLQMVDHGGNLGANVDVRCIACGEHRNINEALGQRGQQNLPRCRARHPHLGWFDPEGCAAEPQLLVIGASNQWFAETMSALAVPKTGQGELAEVIERHWDDLFDVESQGELGRLIRKDKDLAPLKLWPLGDVWKAVEQRRSAPPAVENDGVDLRTPEWEIFTAKPGPAPHEDFTLFRPGVAEPLREVFDEVVQAERLREVRALVGFTRLDAPDPDDPELVQTAPLSRHDGDLTWVPATEVRGEGIFLNVSEPLLRGWEQRIAGSRAMTAHEDAFVRFRKNRYSGRVPGGFDPARGRPPHRYLALHTLSHMLIRAIALECGYSSASLSERIYAGTDDDKRSGILIYTAVPDAEGTLGGLVTLGEPDELLRLVRRAWRDGMRCSSDPLCADRLPTSPADFLHGAACHVCLFVSETTCERGNRFLDRRFVVPIDNDPTLALVPEML